MPLNIKIQQVDKHTVKIILSGQINSDTYETLDRQINELVQKKISTIILDLADVDFVSSAGVGHHQSQNVADALLRRAGPGQSAAANPQGLRYYEAAAGHECLCQYS